MKEAHLPPRPIFAFWCGTNWIRGAGTLRSTTHRQTL